MTQVEPPPINRYTPGNLLKMDGPFELARGHLIEKKRSYQAGRIVAKLTAALASFSGVNQLGDAVVNVSFRCFPNGPSQVRRPDIAFVAAARTHLVPDEGHVPIPPDLAIEVVSKNDSV